MTSNINRKLQPKKSKDYYHHGHTVKLIPSQTSVLKSIWVIQSMFFSIIHLFTFTCTVYVLKIKETHAKILGFFWEVGVG
jgi:hypothetical protein